MIELEKYLFCNLSPPPPTGNNLRSVAVKPLLMAHPVIKQKLVVMVHHNLTWSQCHPTGYFQSQRGEASVQQTDRCTSP